MAQARTVEEVVDVAAPPERVWAVLADLRDWPSWTSSVRSVEPSGDSLAVGTTALVRQPRLPAAVWTVTELDPGRGFTWVSRSGGLVTTGGHHVAPAPGGSRVVLTLRQDGVLAPLVGLLYGRLVRRYVATEAVGLKRRCEQP